MTQTTQEPVASDPNAGMLTRIREALRQVADDVAAKNTRTVIAVPGKEISEAMFRIFSDVPRVPDYDPEAAGKSHHDSVIENYAADEIPPDPIRLSVWADEEGDRADDPSVVIAFDDGQAVVRTPFDPDVAERLFLEGLAACRYARARSKYAAPHPVD